MILIIGCGIMSNFLIPELNVLHCGYELISARFFNVKLKEGIEEFNAKLVKIQHLISIGFPIGKIHML